MMIDFVSLIITNYNRNRYLAEAIEKGGTQKPRQGDREHYLLG